MEPKRCTGVHFRHQGVCLLRTLLKKVLAERNLDNKTGQIYILSFNDSCANLKIIERDKRVEMGERQQKKIEDK